MTALEVFEAHRGLLFSIAYRMLGSATEAEDVLQDAYLRFSAASQDKIHSPKAYLSAIVTNLSLDRLRSAQAAREQYLGAWLPEPVLTIQDRPDALGAAEQHESVTLAFLVLLETLTPQERAVFLLREVFEYEYREIAELLELSPANCRQIFHRAHRRILENRPRFKASREKQNELIQSFLEAAQVGELDRLTSLLSQEVVFTADGGGKASAALHPVHGPEAVGKLLVGIIKAAQRYYSTHPGELKVSLAEVNGEPGVLVWADSRLEVTFILSIAEDKIARIWAIRNPDKLRFLQNQFERLELLPLKPPQGHGDEDHAESQGENQG